MARLALLREARLYVVWALGAREVLCMATEALRRGPRELVADVASCAGRLRMGAPQCEASELIVIELGALPAVHGVTGSARNGQVRRAMVQWLGTVIVGPMATDAFRAQPGENAGSRAAVARFAGGHRMGSQQGEPVLMVANGLHGGFPAQNRVAFLARRAELPAVDIGMAILALLSDVAEDLLYVAR
jgi:hypothetical protein